MAKQSGPHRLAKHWRVIDAVKDGDRIRPWTLAHIVRHLMYLKPQRCHFAFGDCRGVI